MHHKSSSKPLPHKPGRPAIYILAASVFVALVLWITRPSDDLQQSEFAAEIVETDIAYTVKQFSRDDDIQRAERFRIQDQKERQIRAWLTAAQTHIERREYALPTNNSAIEKYKKVLRLEPDNTEAKYGIEFVVERLLVDGKQALQDGNLQRLQLALTNLRLIAPQSRAFAELQSIIENWQVQRQITVLLNQAQTAEKNKQLTEPPGQNAQYYYQQILTIDTEHAAALVGLERIAKRLINDASPQHQAAPSDEQQSLDQEALEHGLEAYANGDYQIAASLLQPLADKGLARAQARLAYMHYFGHGFIENHDKAKQLIANVLPTIQEFAEEGRSWAQSDMGSLYENGLGVKKNLVKAVKWYRLAAEQGYPAAQSRLGHMYQQGLGVIVNHKMAIQWLQQAAKQGDQTAQRSLSDFDIYR